MSRPALAFAITLICGPAFAAGTALTPCDLTLSVTDKDPAGLNVRATPGGTIVNALKHKPPSPGGGDSGLIDHWVEVHVTGDAGAWASIDTADDTDNEGETTPIAGVSGFVAFSKLGILGLSLGGQVFAEPRAGARIVFEDRTNDWTKIPPATVLGCSGHYAKVRIAGVVGWTRDF